MEEWQIKVERRVDDSDLENERNTVCKRSKTIYLRSRRTRERGRECERGKIGKREGREKIGNRGGREKIGERGERGRIEWQGVGGRDRNVCI